MRILKKKFNIFFINLIVGMIITYMIFKFLFFWLEKYTKHNVSVKIPNLYSLTINQAKEILTRLGLHYEIDTSNYNPKYVPYYIYNFAPPAGGIVKPGRVIFIQANANTFNFTKLPNIFFKTKYFALSRLYAKHFLVKNIFFVQNKNKGLILKVIHNNKYVNHGDALPYRSELDLVIGEGVKKNIIVPNVIGMNLSSAKGILKKNKIIIGNIFYDKKNYNQDIINQKIYRQYPSSNSIINNKEQFINLWISNNSQENYLNKNNEEIRNNKYLDAEVYENKNNSYQNEKND